jgi:hypothetical protein
MHKRTRFYCSGQIYVTCAWKTEPFKFQTLTKVSVYTKWVLRVELKIVGIPGGNLEKVKA